MEQGWRYEPAWDIQAVAAAASAAGLYFLVQSTTASLANGLTSGQPFRRIWRDSFGWMMLQQAVTGMVGLLLGRTMQTGMTFFTLHTTTSRADTNQCAASRHW